MARLSELVMATSEAKTERDLLAKIVGRAGEAGVDNDSGLAVEFTLGISRAEYRTLKGILAASDRNLGYWQKRIKRGR